MTRENKLALVVGFGLILLVGILISDHFSAARNQQPAELSQVVDPLDETRWDDPELIQLETDRDPPREAPMASSDTPPPASGVRPVDPIAGTGPVPMGRGASPGVGLSAAEADTLPYRIHHVQGGESLTAICRHYYGDGSLIDELAGFNGLADPNLLRVGRRLRIPSANDLVRGRPIAGTPGTQGGAPASGPYTVNEGDTLSLIAQRFLGSGKKYLVIYEANRDVLASPDDLKPGMRLKIPRSTS